MITTHHSKPKGLIAMCRRSQDGGRGQGAGLIGVKEWKLWLAAALDDKSLLTSMSASLWAALPASAGGITDMPQVTGPRAID